MITNTAEPQALLLEELQNPITAPKKCSVSPHLLTLFPVPSSCPSRYSPFFISHIKQIRSGRHHA